MNNSRQKNNIWIFKKNNEILGCVGVEKLSLVINNEKYCGKLLIFKKDKSFSMFIKSREIQKNVKKIANQINNDMVGKIPLFIVVLNGAFIFASDLLKLIKVDCEITFVKLSSYSGTTSTHIVRELIGLDEIIKGLESKSYLEKNAYTIYLLYITIVWYKEFIK